MDTFYDKNRGYSPIAQKKSKKRIPPSYYINQKVGVCPSGVVKKICKSEGVYPKFLYKEDNYYQLKKVLSTVEVENHRKYFIHQQLPIQFIYMNICHIQTSY